MDGDLSQVLHERTDEVLASWSHRFDRSGMRVPKSVDPRQHASLIQAMIIALGETVQERGTLETRGSRRGTIPPQRLVPGAPDVRELEKAAGLLGASGSASGLSGFDVAALVFALRDAVLEFASDTWAPSITDLFEWLVVIALDGFAKAGTASASEKAAEQLEEGTPVVLVTPEVPAVLLVGAPKKDALDSILARALLLVVRTGAPSIVLDVSGLTDPVAPEVLAAVGRFLDQKRMEQVEVVLSGVTAGVAEAWGRLTREKLVHMVDRFDAAVARALDRAGVQLVRRSR
jgi:hypothetical protein